MIAELEAACTERSLEHVGINTSTVKKRATGKGNAPKPAMLAAARERWPELDVESHDLADALWVSVCAAEAPSHAPG